MGKRCFKVSHVDNTLTYWLQVLQEVAAARDVRVLCGPKDLNGFSFCTGLQMLSKEMGSQSDHPVVSLIREAISRSPRMSMSKYSLGELLDMYHTYEASKRHDKVYALLGMINGDPQTDALVPDYAIPWEQLLHQVVHHILGNGIRCQTWPDQEISMISGRGYIIGTVSEVYNDVLDHDLESSFGVIEIQTGRKLRWIIPTLMRPPQYGDIVCILQGARTATVVRPCNDYFAIVMIDLRFEDNLDRVTRVTTSKGYDFTLLWNWGVSRNGSAAEESTLAQSLSRLDSNLDRLRGRRLYDITRVFCYLGACRKAHENLKVLQDKTFVNDLDTAQTTVSTDYMLVTWTNIGERYQANFFLIQEAQEHDTQNEERYLWDLLSDYKPLERHWSWIKISKVVQALKLTHDDFKENNLVEIVTDPDNEVASILTRKRMDIFQYSETALFVLLKQEWDQYKRRYGADQDGMIRQLLIREEDDDTHNLERVLKLTAACQGGAAAIVRIALMRRNQVGLPGTLVLDGVREHPQDKSIRSNILKILAEQEEAGIHVSNEIRIAAKESPAQAVENLMGLLRTRKIEVTEEMVTIAAENCRRPTIEMLLREAKPGFKVTSSMFHAASQNSLPDSGVIQAFLDFGIVEPEVLEQYLDETRRLESEIKAMLEISKVEDTN